MTVEGDPQAGHFILPGTAQNSSACSAAGRARIPTSRPGRLFPRRSDIAQNARLMVTSAPRSVIIERLGNATSLATRSVRLHDLSRRLAEIRSRVEERLNEALRPEPGFPEPLREAMRYSLLAPGKRLRPVLVVLAAEACGGDERRPVAGRLRRGDDPRLFADSRRPAGHGRRRPAPRPADVPQEIRRGDGHPGRRRPADAGVSGAGRGLSRRPRPPRAAGNWPAPPAPPAWSADRWTTWRWERRASGVARPAARDGRSPTELGTPARPQDRGTDPRQPPARGAGRPRRRTRRRPRLLERLDGYGRCLGLAFQITDDLLDVEGSADRAGKRVRKGRRPRQADVPRTARRRREPPPRRTPVPRGPRAAAPPWGRPPPDCWPWSRSSWNAIGDGPSTTLARPISLTAKDGISHDRTPVANRVARRPARPLGRPARRAGPGDARRAGARPQHPPGPLRQQPRRRRAVPRPAPDLRLPPRPRSSGTPAIRFIRTS